MVEHGGQAPNPLRAARCPQCGYSWQGLAEQGMCPECGLAYGPDLVVVWGPEGNLLARTTPGLLARVRRWWLVVLIVLMAAARWLFQFRPELEDYAGLLIPLLLVSAWAARRWWAWRQGLAQRWQLRLGPDGFAQREFLGPVTLHPWTADVVAYVYIERYPPLAHAGLGRWSAEKRWVRVQISRPAGVNGQPLLVGFGFGCEAEVARWLQERVERWLIAARQAGSVAHEQ